MRIAADSILSHRLRSILTVVGVMIGVAVVALVAALLEGAQRYVGQEAAELGPGIIVIRKASFQDFVGDAQAFIEAQSKRPDVEISDIAGLQEKLGSRFEVGGQIDASLPVQRGNQTLTGIAIQGVTPNITALSSLSIEAGRELTVTDDEFRRSVCVIGADVAEFLFPDRDPLGENIKVGSGWYEVVGVFAERGSAFGASQDAIVQMPLSSFAKLFGARSRSIALLAKAKPDPVTGVEPTSDQIEDSVRFAMRQQRQLAYRDADNFSFISAKSVEAFIGRLTGIVGAVLFPLTGIALAVGGIVVMNMMLASVTERTREIGIRKSLGARRRDILAQFLVESTMLTLMGGAVGVGLAWLLVWLAARLTGFPVGMPLWALLMAIVVSCTVGIVFGVFPARRAARLDPIEALRTE